MTNEVKEPIDILRDIWDYMEGNGKYDFTGVSQYDMANLIFDAKLEIVNEMRRTLKEYENAE